MKDFIGHFFKTFFAKGNMKGFITIWAVALFTFAFLEDTDDAEYRILLISTFSLAVGMYIGRSRKDDEE